MKQRILCMILGLALILGCTAYAQTPSPSERSLGGNLNGQTFAPLTTVTTSQETMHTPTAAYNQPPTLVSKTSSVKPSSKNTKEVTVYITKTGNKYHRAGCRYLSKSQIPISLSQVKKKYTPCSVCRPPQ